MKACAEVVSFPMHLHICHAPAMLHLTGSTFRLRGDHWQSYGSGKSVPPYLTTHVEIILVRLHFFLPGQQLDSRGALDCTVRKITRYYVLT